MPGFSECSAQPLRGSGEDCCQQEEELSYQFRCKLQDRWRWDGFEAAGGGGKGQGKGVVLFSSSSGVLSRVFSSTVLLWGIRLYGFISSQLLVFSVSTAYLSRPTSGIHHSGRCKWYVSKLYRRKIFTTYYYYALPQKSILLLLLYYYYYIVIIIAALAGELWVDRYGWE